MFRAQAHTPELKEPKNNQTQIYIQYERYVCGTMKEWKIGRPFNIVYYLYTHIVICTHIKYTQYGIINVCAKT